MCSVMVVPALCARAQVEDSYSRYTAKHDLLSSAPHYFLHLVLIGTVDMSALLLMHRMEYRSRNPLNATNSLTKTRVAKFDHSIGYHVA